MLCQHARNNKEQDLIRWLNLHTLPPAVLPNRKQRKTCERAGQPATRSSNPTHNEAIKGEDQCEIVRMERVAKFHPNRKPVRDEEHSSRGTAPEEKETNNTPQKHAVGNTPVRDVEVDSVMPERKKKMSRCVCPTAQVLCRACFC